MKLKERSRSSIITLLTDFGMRDGYVGMMKGVIANINPEVKVIDISHEVPPQDVMEASYLLDTSYKYFPKGTVHLAVVDPGVGTRRRAICLRAGGCYFIAPDNGLLTLILQRERAEKIVEITNKKYFLMKVSDTFHGRDIFAPVAAHLSKGVRMEELGRRIQRIKRVALPKAILSSEGMRGEVVHVDRFGNLVTNIDREIFKQFVDNLSGKGFKIRVGNKSISKVNSSFAESKPGEVLAIFGSSDMLEISVCGGNAQMVLGVGKGKEIEVGKKRRLRTDRGNRG